MTPCRLGNLGLSLVLGLAVLIDPASVEAQRSLPAPQRDQSRQGMPQSRGQTPGDTRPARPDRTEQRRPAPTASTATPGPQGPENGPLRRQLWLIPSPDKGTLMRTTVFRPPGDGPFPLVIINHGSIEAENRRAEMRDPVFMTASRWFVQRGYAVAVPQRPGHGETGGIYIEAQGGCATADYYKSGLATASSIEAAMTYMTAQPFVRKEGVLVVGQSAGGWGTLALASRNPPQVRAIINFAGGRGGRSYNRAHNNCVPERLAETAGRFGATTKLPALWLYTLNDTYFGPDLSQRMVENYQRAGGKLEFHLLPAFGEDGHDMFGSPDGVETWGPIVAKFLAGLK